MDIDSKERRLEEVWQRILDLWAQEHDIDAALELADQVWAEEFPGDTDAEKASSHFMAQSVTSAAMEGAAVFQRREEAHRWMDRYVLSYGGEPLDPLYEHVWVEVGKAHYQLGEIDEARRVLSRLLKEAGRRPFAEENPVVLKLARGEEVPDPTLGVALANAEVAGESEELGEELEDQLQELADQGSELFDAGDFEGAVRVWFGALQLLPEPYERWEQTEWFLVSLADAFWFLNGYEQVEAFAQEAVNVMDGAANPFTWLRLGQAQFELGKFDEALESLTGGFMLEGHELFEDEDSKYLEFLRERGIKGV